MSDQRLIEFIRQSIQQGISREQIFAILKEKGWVQKDVQEAFERVVGEEESFLQGSAESSANNEIASQLQRIQGKFVSLEARFDAYEERLNRLEGEQQKFFVPPERAESVQQKEPSHRTAAPAAPPPVMTEGHVEKKKTVHWETFFGGNWMVKIGVFAVLLGAVFFLKLSFDNNWIGVTGRIALGIMGGFILLGAGEYWREKYRQYSQILTGGGIALLYLSIYAAHAFYSLIGAYPTFGFMILVTATAGALAIRYEAVGIAILGMLGGFFTPFMFLTKVDGVLLIGYIAVLDVGILAISAFRNWRPLLLLGLVGSYVNYLLWVSLQEDLLSVATREAALTLIFIIFAVATIMWHLVWKKRVQQYDIALIVGNVATYFLLSYFVLVDQYEQYLGFFAFAVAGFYIFLAYFSLSRATKDVLLPLVLGGVGLAALTTAMPLQLDGVWITIAWAVEGAVLIWVGFLLSSVHMRIGALVVLLLAAMRLLIFDSFFSRAELENYLLFTNERFFAFLVVILAFYASAYAYHWGRARLVDERERKLILPAMLLMGNFFTLLIFTLEVSTFFDKQIAAARSSQVGAKIDYSQITNLKYAQNFAISILWGLYAITAVVIGIAARSIMVRLFGLTLFIVTILKVFTIDLFQIGGIWRVASLLSLGVVLLFTGYIYSRYSNRIKEMFLSK